MSGDGVAELWEAYHRSPGRPTRDPLIVHYSPLVKYVAGRVAVGLPHNVEQADLVARQFACGQPLGFGGGGPALDQC